MDEHKIQNFKKEYPKIAFPDFRTLSVAEAENIREAVRDKLGIHPDATPLEIVIKLSDDSTVISGVNPEADNFSLKSTVLQTGVQPNEQVLINWYRFDAIDEISLDDLTSYFDDIWYPTSDDIDIFDTSISWMISVGHLGDVSVWRPS
ncbi:MAG: hypothetical protein AAB288_01870 [Acidobacteriota bacterium]|mgnify:CR=1 FL=1